jgi:hypothetical protein
MSHPMNCMCIAIAMASRILIDLANATERPPLSDLPGSYFLFFVS